MKSGLLRVRRARDTAWLETGRRKEYSLGKIEINCPSKTQLYAENSEYPTILADKIAKIDIAHFVHKIKKLSNPIFGWINNN